MPRARTSAWLLACALALLGAAPAAADTGELQARQAVARDCLGPLEPGSAGADRFEWTAPASGILTATLDGGSAPDWDLALLREGETIGASTSFTSDETALAWVDAGERVVIQACRLRGGATSIPLALDLFEMPKPGDSDPRISLESVTIGGSDDLQRLERLGFDVTHDVEPGSATVVAYSNAERARLADAGFDSIPAVRDLVATDAADRMAEAQAAQAGLASALPSGREQYREYTDFTTQMKELATANPDLVRSLEIGRTFEDRPIEGVEIAAGVNRTDDGRPVFLNFGAHHAREWPSAELPMEFALDLVASYNAGDPRVVSLLERVRVVVVPIVNVDGFIVSRGANGGATTPADDDSFATLAQAVADSGAYKRKNCRPTDPGQAAAPCATRTTSGVDLNRNYGAYWGGPGSSTDTTTQSYRGTAPFSEPESEAVHRYTAGIHPTVFISNHTFTEGRWLRQPGFDAEFLPQAQVPTYDDGCPANDDGDMGALSPDEAGMKSLGDAMASANGWISELGYESLCDITGATEDWNYFSQGTYGYTPEVRGTNFHANYADMVVAEYVGGDTTGDPANQETNPFGMRESYLIAAERAANPAEHSVIEGPAPPGAVLTLRKAFDTPTCESAACPRGDGASFDDVLETRLVVPADGSFEWHVNPSGRPLHPNETWTMSCRLGNGASVSRQVAVARGQRVSENFSGCGPSTGGGGTGGGGSGGGGGAADARCGGRPATIVGTAAAETFKGTRGVDVIIGAGATDRIRAAKGNDVVCGRAGADKILGGAGRDRLRGGNGKDLIRGGPGKDRCRGGRAKDRLKSCE